MRSSKRKLNFKLPRCLVRHAHVTVWYAVRAVCVRARVRAMAPNIILILRARAWRHRAGRGRSTNLLAALARWWTRPGRRPTYMHARYSGSGHGRMQLHPYNHWAWDKRRGASPQRTTHINFSEHASHHSRISNFIEDGIHEIRFRRCVKWVGYCLN